jgi:hypothetical protein
MNELGENTVQKQQKRKVSSYKQKGYFVTLWEKEDNTFELEKSIGMVQKTINVGNDIKDALKKYDKVVELINDIHTLELKNSSYIRKSDGTTYYLVNGVFYGAPTLAEGGYNSTEGSPVSDLKLSKDEIRSLSSEIAQYFAFELFNLN